MHDVFEYYPVSGDEVRTAANTTRSKGDAVHTLLGLVEKDHKQAVQAVEGALRYTVVTSPAQARQAAQEVGRKTAWASCQLEEFADAVDLFNLDSTKPRSVSKLNAAYFSAEYDNFGVPDRKYPDNATKAEKAEVDDQWSDDYLAAYSALMKDLRAEYAQLDENLDTAARSVASKLQREPTDAELVDAWKAGNLPVTAMLLWPELHLDPLDIKGLPPELATLTGDELKSFLAMHPELAPIVNHLLTKEGPLTPQEAAVVNAQAAVDADTLKRGLATQPPSREGLETLATAQERLALINTQVADGTDLTDVQRQYLTTYLDAVGAVNLAKLPGYVERAFDDAAPPGMPGYVRDGLHADYLDRYVAPTADAIMNLSNPDVGGYRTAAEMPQAVRTLLDLRIGESYNGMRFGDAGDELDPTFDTVKNLDTFNGFADLMSASTVEGGTDFTKELGETALQAKQDLNAMLSNLGRQSTYGFVDGQTFEDLKAELGDDGVSDLLSVVGRNSDASSALINASDDNLRRVLGLNWDDGQGAADVIHAATDRDGSDGQGGTEAQAQSALRIMMEVAEDPSEFEYRVDNELVSDAIVDTAVTWIDTFGNDVVSGDQPGVNTDAHDLLGRDIDFSLTMSPEDRSQFMQYVASTGDEDAVRVQAAAQVYGSQLIRDALATDDPVAVNQAMGWAGRADGTITQANFEWAIDRSENKDDAATAAHLADVRKNAAINTGITMVKSIGITATGAAFPPAAPFLSVGDAVVSPIINEALNAGPAPDTTAIDTREEFYNRDQVESSHVRNYQLAMAIDAEGGADDPQYSVLYTADGSLKPMQDIDPAALDRLAQERLDRWEHDHRQDLNIEAYDTERDNIMNGSHADNDRVATSGWRDDDDARTLLYGDNVPKGFEDDWDNGSRSLYSPDSEKVDDNVWNFKPDDEAAQIRDARGDIAQLEDDLKSAEKKYGKDSDQADDIRDDLEDRRDDLDELLKG